MMFPRCARVCALLGLLAATPAMAAGPEGAPADSLTTVLPAVTVSGEKAELPSPDRTRIDAPRLAVQDPGSLADVAGLIPSARVVTNSRGETPLMIRGAPERHVQVFLDGIPLNLPWDERADLRIVPVVGTSRLEGTRGLTTLLDGPGVLAGSVKILTPTPEPGAPRNRVAFTVGEHVLGSTELEHNGRLGAWDVLAAGGWHGRNAVNLPSDTVERDGSDRRLNSDLSQYAALVRGSRAVREVGRLSLLGTYWTAEQGVPAELHLPDADARFWRYPVRERALLGATLEVPLDREGRWDLATALSADFFRQEIDPRGPDGWDAELQTGDDYEKNWDRTGYGKARLTHWLGDTTQLAVQGTARYTHHREILTVGGPTDAYSQWLASLVAEFEFHPVTDWQVRLGAGIDHVATPESGPQPANEAASHGTWNARLTRPLPGNAEAHLAASRRTRAPSLRELYSGALGRFVPNPDLAPEQQVLYEAGYARVATRWRIEAAAFLLYLEDGIERISLDNPARQFQRVNRTEIRVPGIELAGSWGLGPDLDLAAQHTILAARVKDDADFDRPAEDRPDYLSRLGLNWAPPRGPNGLAEAVVTGPRWSADATDPSGLRRLPAGVVWNARLGWRFDRPARGLEAHLRLDNVFNTRVDDQVGLPNGGRTFSGGLAVRF
ncbi:TonB-dependent receptor [bacterium]|nr:TonB-dependent receptor [bacterium]